MRIKILLIAGCVLSVSGVAMAIGPLGDIGKAAKGNRNVETVDYKVAGPGGQVIIFYKDGKDVVVVNCGSDYKQTAKIKARKDCTPQGPENRVPLEAFKQSMKANFSILNPDKLKPFTKEEIEAYKKTDTGKIDRLAQRKTEIQSEIADINEFVTNHYNGKPDEASKAKLDKATGLLAEVEAELLSAKAGTEAVRKINALVDKLVDEEISGSSMHSVNVVEHESDALFSLLTQYDASRGAECGTDEILNGGPRAVPGTQEKGARGTWLKYLISEAIAADARLDERIRDCAKLIGSSKSPKGVEWNLVSRKRDPKSGKFYEVWRDKGTGLVWGDTLDKTDGKPQYFTHDNFYEQNGYGHAVRLDKKEDGKVVEEVACNSADGARANAGLKEFKLPAIEDYQQAEKNGIRDVVPNIKDRYFWSASLYPDDRDFARYFNGSNGYSYSYFRDGQYSVRCVSR